MSQSKVVRAPFIAEQIAAIRGWQMDDTVHPMRCGNDHHHRPRESGLYCLDCDYTQSWAPWSVAGWRP